MMLKDKVAVIYGAGGAIGSAVARAFAREGAKLFLTGLRLAPVEAVAKEVTEEEVGSLPLGSRVADVDLHLARPVGGWAKVAVATLTGAKRHANGFDRRHEDTFVLDVANADLNVDNGFGGQTRNRGRPDVFNPYRRLAKGSGETLLPRLEPARPLRVVCDNLHRVALLTLRTADQLKAEHVGAQDLVGQPFADIAVEGTDAHASMGRFERVPIEQSGPLAISVMQSPPGGRRVAEMVRVNTCDSEPAASSRSMLSTIRYDSSAPRDLQAGSERRVRNQAWVASEQSPKTRRLLGPMWPGKRRSARSGPRSRSPSGRGCVCSADGSESAKLPGSTGRSARRGLSGRMCTPGSREMRASRSSRRTRTPGSSPTSRPSGAPRLIPMQ
jgi:hypothetical protein